MKKLICKMVKGKGAEGRSGDRKRHVEQTTSPKYNFFVADGCIPLRFGLINNATRPNSCSLCFLFFSLKNNPKKNIWHNHVVM
jgi:hypothetical protein